MRLPKLDKLIDDAISEGATIMRQNSDDPQLVILGENHIHARNLTDPLAFFEMKPEYCYCECVNSGDRLGYNLVKGYHNLPDTPLLLGTFKSCFWDNSSPPQNKGAAWIYIHRHFDDNPDVEFIGSDLSPFEDGFILVDIRNRAIVGLLESNLSESNTKRFDTTLQNGSEYDLFKFLQDVTPESKYLPELRTSLGKYNAKRENRMGETIKSTIEGKTALFPVGGFHVRETSKIYDHLNDIPYVSLSMVKKIPDLGF
ncbi:hypothetical protein GOV11_00295 [Candidatus Woesearchaeota archaeon]|nr:hypothetical protein [Candidatus Woesearchaeota archaeon]